MSLTSQAQRLFLKATGQLRDWLFHTYHPDEYRYPLVQPLPEHVYIDPATLCNLRCPVCPTGNRSLRMEKTFLTAAKFSQILDKIPTVRSLDLYNWGESLLNPGILEIIQHARQHGLFIRVHSNFSFHKPAAFFRGLVESKLDELTISADGATQEVYEKYRVGGNLSLVLENVRQLVRIKQELKSDLPQVTWKFVVNRYSEPQIDLARQMAAEIGIPFQLSEMGLGEFVPDPPADWDYRKLYSEWAPKDKHYARRNQRDLLSRPLIPGPCPFLAPGFGPTITPAGKVLPCCYIIDEKWAFGDIFQQSFEEIWNGPKYQSARHLFSCILSEGSLEETICHRCETYRKARHNQRPLSK